MFELTNAALAAIITWPESTDNGAIYSEKSDFSTALRLYRNDVISRGVTSDSSAAFYQKMTEMVVAEADEVDPEH